MDGSLFKAFLPGIECNGNIQPSLTMSCQPSANPWPLSAGQGPATSATFAPKRNYFEGLRNVSGQSTNITAPFYSWAYQPGGAGTFFFADLTGEIRFVPGDPGNASMIRGLGSDVLVLQSDCGSGWQLLATRPGDWTVSDSVQTYQIANGQVIAAGKAVDFDGPVTALWSPISGKAAYAVVHNLRSGSYEAYRLFVTCGR